MSDSKHGLGGHMSDALPFLCSANFWCQDLWTYFSWRFKISVNMAIEMPEMNGDFNGIYIIWMVDVKFSCSIAGDYPLWSDLGKLSNGYGFNLMVLQTFQSKTTPTHHSLAFLQFWLAVDTQKSSKICQGANFCFTLSFIKRNELRQVPWPSVSTGTPGAARIFLWFHHDTEVPAGEPQAQGDSPCLYRAATGIVGPPSELQPASEERSVDPMILREEIEIVSGGWSKYQAMTQEFR